MRAVRIRGRHLNSRQPSGFNLNISTAGFWGGLMRGIQIPLQDFALKNAGVAYARGGAYLRETTVLVHGPIFCSGIKY